MTNKAGRPRQQTPIPLGLNRFILLAIACVSCVFNGPIVFNWPPLREVMEKSGAYAWECDGKFDGSGTCNAQRIAITRCGNLAQTMMFVGSVFAGVFVDQFGPKLCSTLGAILFVLSYLFLGVSSEAAPLYLLAWFLNGTAIEFCFMGLLTIPNLFPSKPRVSMAILGTFRSLSMVYAIAINWMVKDSFPLKKASWVCCGIAAFWAIVNFFILPNDKFFLIVRAEERIVETAESQADLESTGAIVARSVSEDDLIIEAPHEDSLGHKGGMKNEFKDFLDRALTFTYLAWLIFFALSYTRGGFYGLSVPDQSPDVAVAFTWLSPLSFVPCPFLGIAADYFGMLPVLVFLNSCGTIMFLCLVIGDALALQWIAVILSSVLLSFLASQNYCWIAEAYRENVQGKLAGLAMCVAGLISLVNTPLYTWGTNENAFKKVDAMFLCFSAFNFFLLGFIWYNRKSTQGAVSSQKAIADLTATNEGVAAK
eukprot:Gregarina_sp_Poly_1__2663@NODE_1728_length_3449_cov_460_761975_g1130_i0_p1_GENE_NODE_1728_length_3449_cov_460_761975_g1130_i0NODE_1728_length_3449_cov_460_761975_g1130_i0_p1_ORF_typecomplete_len481_score47_20Sugar_tr/PF00083_24/7_8e15MFS_1/PF07690_16/1_2e03MFS_1/PF07690_16/8e14MFS_1/PF07690_16/0_0016Nodulinlike/PF06813_13/0_00011Nodulinlike/PF06813_13/4_6e02DUF3852/PF12963_7/0_01_NODE_1728_length_3449_cov_460_761975_g1130_i04001842